jgi:hypothetical protein
MKPSHVPSLEPEKQQHAGQGHYDEARLQQPVVDHAHRPLAKWGEGESSHCAANVVENVKASGFARVDLAG